MHNAKISLLIGNRGGYHGWVCKESVQIKDFKSFSKMVLRKEKVMHHYCEKRCQ